MYIQDSSNYTTAPNGKQQQAPTVTLHVHAAADPLDLIDLYANGDSIPQNDTPLLPQFTPIARRDLRNRPPKEFIIDGLLGKNDTAMIFGAPGSGKTFVVIDLILAAVTGAPFMDRYAVPLPLNVVYATNEGFSGLNERLTASENKYIGRLVDGVLQATDSRLTIFEDMPQLYDQKTPFNMVKFVNQLQASGLQIDLLILDTLSNAILQGDENLSSHMAIAMDTFKQACKALGCAGVLVHHTNKGGGYRGSSVLHGTMDLALEVAKDEYQHREAKIFKMKDRRKNSPGEGESFPFFLQGDDVTESCYPVWDNDSERAGRKVQQPSKPSDDDMRDTVQRLIADKPISQKQLATFLSEKFGLGRNSALSKLKSFEDTGLLSANMGGATNREKYYQLPIKDTIN